MDDRRRLCRWTLVCCCLLLAAPLAWAQAPAACQAHPTCAAAQPATQNAPASPAAPADDPLAGIVNPPIFDSIPGGCCPAGGSSKCPKVTGRHVVGCGGNCGNGHAACLYL